MTTQGSDPRLTAGRLARRAMVYVRQSTQKQVEQNRESRELQYAMVERARMLGWKRVDVIDDDLGASAGFAAAPREGFERMLAAVALGEVGITISREASPVRLDALARRSEPKVAPRHARSFSPRRVLRHADSACRASCAAPRSRPAHSPPGPPISRGSWSGSSGSRTSHGVSLRAVRWPRMSRAICRA